MAERCKACLAEDHRRCDPVNEWCSCLCGLLPVEELHPGFLTVKTDTAKPRRPEGLP